VRAARCLRRSASPLLAPINNRSGKGCDRSLLPCAAAVPTVRAAGNPMLLSYAATKGAILAFTRSLAAQLVEKGIRVNAVAPGCAPSAVVAAALRPALNTHHVAHNALTLARAARAAAPSGLRLSQQPSPRRRWPSSPRCAGTVAQRRAALRCCGST
jgi:NAD(P)-dependent dehydrogenase (short-subunit alcohol dehydrogenase family)